MTTHLPSVLDTKKAARIAVRVRLYKDVVEALKAYGPNWEDRVNALLRENIKADRLKDMCQT